MSIGPVEYIAIAFPGNKFSGKIIPAIKELQDSGTIRRPGPRDHHQGRGRRRRAIELSEASPKSRRPSRPSASRAGTCSARRTSRISVDALDPNSTAALMIWENVWAEKFASSLRDADGILIANGRIPAALVEEVMAESVS